jgi:hypothetical protein
MLIHSLKTFLVIFCIGYAAFAYSQTSPATANEGHGSEEVGIIDAFAGNDGKWIGIDLGITLRFTIINEDSRYKLDPNSNPSNPTYIKTAGRGASLR